MDKFYKVKTVSILVKCLGFHITQSNNNNWMPKWRSNAKLINDPLNSQ